MRKNEKEGLICDNQADFADFSKHTFRGLIVWLFLFLALQNGVAQEVTSISGLVKDDTGQPLIGVSVMIKGTGTGGVTDLDGRFKIESPTKRGILIFTYVGMEKKEVAYNGTGPLNIILKSVAVSLNEVVAIGYGVMKKRDLTGAVSSVKTDEITLNPGSNPLQAIQGRVAGLDITKSSGQAGAPIAMQIRGVRSFKADGNPLILIDGVPGDFSTLNPNDIASVDVLKDASSTAVYGASGANGVILITTKQGTSGTMKVNLNAFSGFNGWSTVPKVYTGAGYLQLLRDAYTATGEWTSASDDDAILTKLGIADAYKAGKFINWPKEVLHDGYTQNYSLSVAGGNDKTQGYISLNYANEKGQFYGDNYSVFSTNIRLEHKVKKWLKIGGSLQASYVTQNKAATKLENAIIAAPLGELYNADGSLRPKPMLLGSSNFFNLKLNEQKNVYANMDQNMRMYFTPFIEFEPIKGLTLNSRLTTSLEFLRNNSFQGVGSYGYYSAGGLGSVDANVWAQITQNRNYNYRWENIATYNFRIKNDHDFTLTAVATYDYRQHDESLLRQTNIAENKYKWYNIDINSINTRGSSAYTMLKNIGYIGRMSYSYMGKYLASLSVRYDGASVLAEGKKWDVFPAGSLGWRISDEPFMEGTQGFMNNLKIRLGYGVTGTANINPYASLSSIEYKQAADVIGGVAQNTIKSTQFLTNPDLTWEKSYNSNVGLDVSFFKSRIDITVDAYRTTTKGVIWDINLPSTFGLYNGINNPYKMYVNLCETQNTGLELSVNSRNIETGDFKWNSTITYTYNKEEILKLTGQKMSAPPVNGDYALLVGSPVNSFYNFKIDGMWQNGEENDAAVFGCKPGYPKVNIPGLMHESEGVYYKEAADGTKTYYDATNPYKVTNDDRQVLGANTPKWTLGFQNTFTYKNFDLTVFAFMRWGQMIKYKLLTWYTSQPQENTFPVNFNYWTPTNPSNDFPAINAGLAKNNYLGFDGLAFVDGSFLKIKNITLGYTLPGKLSGRAGVSMFRVYGTITNPLVVAKSHLLKDYDPEMNGLIDYPLTKQLVFGVNVSF